MSDATVDPAEAAEAAGDLPFDVVSDVELSRRERFGQWFDQTILATFRIIREDPRSLIGSAIALVFIIMAILPFTGLVPEPRLLRYPASQPAFTILTTKVSGIVVPTGITGFNIAYPFGTTPQGQSIFAQMVWATPRMFQLGIGGAAVALPTGAVVGMTAGYLGGRVDTVLSTITDVIMTLPGLPITILLIIFFQDLPGVELTPFFIGALLAIDGWGGIARGLRSETLSLRNESFAEASSIMGLSTASILRKDILPGIAPLVMIQLMARFRSYAFAVVGLEYLGILGGGGRAWGTILNSAWGSNAYYNPDIYYWLIVPMIFISLLGISTTLLAQSLDRVFNPQIRARHAGDEDEAAMVQGQM